MSTHAQASHPFSALASLREAQRVLAAMLDDAATLRKIDAAALTLAHAFKGGGKALIVGNGGSCCDAGHFAEELTGRFRKDRPPLPAIACNDAGHLTCVANDYGFEHVFARWIQALARPGDVVIILSTSGNSPNCIRAAEAAKTAKAHVIALSGKAGGELARIVPASIIVPGDTSDRIQELHMLILHVLVEGVEHLMGY
jgi:D-sedoheptulose 7-phosphate isomerase